MQTQDERNDLARRIGEAQMCLPELCAMLDIEDEIPEDILKAYRKGRLYGKLAVQTSIYGAAREGTAPAQKQYMDLSDVADQFEVEE